jgi:hypothetical protein
MMQLPVKLEGCFGALQDVGRLLFPGFEVLDELKASFFTFSRKVKQILVVRLSNDSQWSCRGVPVLLL